MEEKPTLYVCCKTTPSTSVEDAAVTTLDLNKLRDLYATILQELGYDLKDVNLSETPKRVAKMMRELIVPEDFNFTTFPFEGEKNGELVLVRDIPFYSLCEHHMIPFFGTADVAYIPEDRIVGLSKIPRLVDYCAKGLQTQERITQRIADRLVQELQPKGVGVVLRARHLCMEMRGVKKYNNFTTTSALRGVFNRPEVRAEFLSLINVQFK